MRRRRHAISPGFSGHYRDVGNSSRKRHGSACKLILSVAALRFDARYWGGVCVMFSQLPGFLHNMSYHVMQNVLVSKQFQIRGVQ